MVMRPLMEVSQLYRIVQPVDSRPLEGVHPCCALLRHQLLMLPKLE